MLLEALVACAGVTLRAVATSLGIDVAGGTVRAEGDLDFRGTLGVEQGGAGRASTTIRLRFELDTDAGDEQLATLLKLTERYCVVLPDARQQPRAQRDDGARLAAELRASTASSVQRRK